MQPEDTKDNAQRMQGPLLYLDRWKPRGVCSVCSASMARISGELTPDPWTLAPNRLFHERSGRAGLTGWEARDRGEHWREEHDAWMWITTWIQM
ncbi:hypothetical protein ColKHC_08473 [Colletotrichum higginsianum]|nr:hypothetical protein ColKHC_08473 [Colletotrichum higginsianum]